MTHAAQLADLIDTAKRVLIFTGAGISTESGIPDFRSPGGVWSKMSPIYYQDFVADREQRREAWRRVYNKTAGWTGASPNAGHFAITKLVECGKVSCVVTQNVDNLHQDAGVPDDKVIEIHGNASYAKCLKCGKRYEYEDLKPRYEADEDLTCLFCEGLLKSATISFGQAMPEKEMKWAEVEAQNADLCISLGSSLVVYPAAAIPVLAKQTGAKYVIINREPTEQDQIADMVINSDIGPLMTDVIERLGV
ncbi:Sir2 family NAD-dependent protein deacetylase [Ponticaulis sp.]|uniref:SIR2 family NAD-dependent protein deacylase n=1 Tax=Ponticaulis sp. TaxID=2020902 RepID=UPI000B743276|nr:Sir2 family NAD-dependent protein deacetylase [Ponticaulis sp.]MAI88947.1 NAD-dependent deacetylase [Ponticaulis sp.]OUY01634.1 MAG: NAD-dependent deacetylase [Hyphomonadaceae bacterium TMED5]|tara:strand:- start:69452 stop:70201 length:750 start_codon:yes stop_codon:yes gene_type:complete